MDDVSAPPQGFEIIIRTSSKRLHKRNHQYLGGTVLEGVLPWLKMKRLGSQRETTGYYHQAQCQRAHLQVQKVLHNAYRLYTHV